jgi:integrase
MRFSVHMNPSKHPDPWPDFLRRVAEEPRIPLPARPYYVTRVKDWLAAGGAASPAATRTWFDDLARRPGIADWNFRQAVSAIALWTRTARAPDWAAAFPWRALADEAKALQPGHRSFGRESHPVPARSHPQALQTAGIDPRAPPDPAEVAAIAGETRRAIRLANLAYATEQTYVHWNTRLTRFAHARLGRSPRADAPAAVAAYLEFLALERQVAPATQKQALNAMAFLLRQVFGLQEFKLDLVPAKFGYRRPPVVLSREEVARILGFLDGPWKLAAQLMYGSGLRLMESLRLRVKDLDFDRGTITVHDGKGGKHRVVPLPRSLEPALTAHLASCREKHARAKATGAGEVHMPESLARKWPRAPSEWAWQFVFAAASLCPHPRTGRIARHHLHETSMQKAEQCDPPNPYPRHAPCWFRFAPLARITHGQG